MKLALKDIYALIDNCKKLGYKIMMNDVAYVLLLENFRDRSIPYKILFSNNANDKQIEAYDNSEKIKFLKKYVKSNFKDAKAEKEIEKINDGEYDDISFEENKAYMLNLKKQTEEGIASGKIKQDKGIEILSKLSIALNEKFSVKDKQEDRKIIVYAKYNHICEWTNKECFLQTKEYAMQHWGLIEDPKYKNKIEEEGI